MMSYFTASLCLGGLLDNELTPQTEGRDIRCGCDTLVWNVKFCLCGVFTSPTQTYCSSRVIFHYLSLPHMYIFTVSVLIPEPMPIISTMKIWQIRLQRMSTVTSAPFVIFALCTSHVNTLSDVEWLVNQTLEHA